MTAVSRKPLCAWCGGESYHYPVHLMVPVCCGCGKTPAEAYLAAKPGYQELIGMKLETKRLSRRKPSASADTHPKDGDVKQAPLVSGAVPKADAQTPPPSTVSAIKPSRDQGRARANNPRSANK